MNNNMEDMNIIDEFQKVDDRFWISKSIPLKSCFEEMARQCDEVKGSVTTDLSKSQKVAALMDVSVEDIKQMEKEVSASFLTIENEMKPIKRSDALARHASNRSVLLPPEASDIPDEARASLKSLQLRVSDESAAVKKKLKYERYGLPSLVNDQSVSSGDQLKKNDVILVVRIYNPTEKADAADKTKWFFPRCDQQFKVYGRQLLTELRDKIVCPKDKEPIGTQGLPEALRRMKVSDGATEGELGASLTAGDKFKSSYFFVENIFYVDSRDESMHDLSEPIRRKAESLGVILKTAAMQLTKFIDMNIRFGRPYLFLHQGNCEHLMVFSDARLVHEDDKQNESAYPDLTHVSAAAPMFCMVCKKIFAKWVTFNNMNVTEDPFYFCEDCYASFNFDREGNKTNSFEAFPFVDRNEVL